MKSEVGSSKDLNRGVSGQLPTRTIPHCIVIRPDEWFFWFAVVLVGSSGELSLGSWSWWAMVGLYIYPVGNCPQWGVVLEPNRGPLVWKSEVLSARQRQLLNGGNSFSYRHGYPGELLADAVLDDAPEAEALVGLLGDLLAPLLHRVTHLGAGLQPVR